MCLNHQQTYYFYCLVDDVILTVTSNQLVPAKEDRATAVGNAVSDGNQASSIKAIKSQDQGHESQGQGQGLESRNHGLIVAAYISV